MTKKRSRALIIGAVLVIGIGTFLAVTETQQAPHRFGLVAPSTPGPVVCGSSALNGPSSAPSGAITVTTADSNISGLLPANKTYWFTTGTHNMGSIQILAGTNDIFTGAPGAILNGESTEQFAFLNPTFTNGDTSSSPGVTIEYLTIENYDPPPGNGAVNGGGVPSPNWTIEHDTITDIVPGAGMQIGSDDIVTGNCMTYNGEYGFSAYLEPGQTSTPADPLTNGPTFVTLTNNEIAYNDTCDFEDSQPFPFDIIPPAACNWTGVNATTFTGTPDPSYEYLGCGCSGGGKFWKTNGGDTTGNYLHDNENVGIWWDTENVAQLIMGNYVSDNFGIGLEYEISYNAEMEYNTLVGNAWGEGICSSACGVGGNLVGAIYVSESGYDPAVSDAANPVMSSQTSFAISNDVFDDNWDNVVLWENPNRFCGSTAEPNEYQECVLATPGSYNNKCVPGSSGTCPETQFATPLCTTSNGCSGSEWPGTCGSYNQTSGVMTTSAALLAAQPTGSTAALFYGCRWKTENVQVSGNSFNLDPSGACSENNAGPGCMPPQCTHANLCGEMGLMSVDGTTAPYNGSNNAAIKTAISTKQNNLWCQNSYTGSGITPQVMTPELGSGEQISYTAWLALGQDAATCPNVVPPPVPGQAYTPPATFPDTTPTGTINLPIDPNGCNDGVDSTVGLQNWLNSLRQGTYAHPTVVQFAKTGCYLVNGTIFLWGYQNFQFEYGEFDQTTLQHSQETTTGYGAGSSGCTTLDTGTLGPCLGTYYTGGNASGATLVATVTGACPSGACATVASGGFPTISPGMYVIDTKGDICTGVNVPFSGCTGATKVNSINGNSLTLSQTPTATTGDTLNFGANYGPSGSPVVYNNVSISSANPAVITNNTGASFPSNMVGMGITTGIGFGINGSIRTVASVSGDTMTLSGSANTAETQTAIQLGWYTNQLGSVAGSATAGSMSRSAICSADGTGYGSSPFNDPGGVQPAVGNGAAAANDEFDFMFFVDGGCNIVFRDMYMFGANIKGNNGGVAEQDTMVSFYGTLYGLVYDVSIDGPFGDCVDTAGMYEAPGGGGSYPATNITADQNVCANAGRDDMSIIQASNISYENNLLYWGAVDIFDVETDAICQIGAGDAANLNFSGNTIMDNGFRPVQGDVLSAQTENPAENIAFTNNVMKDSSPSVTGAGRLSVIIHDTDVTYPTAQTGTVTALTGSQQVTVSAGPSSTLSTPITNDMTVTDATTPAALIGTSQAPPYDSSVSGSGQINPGASGTITLPGAWSDSGIRVGDTLDFSNPNQCGSKPPGNQAIAAGSVGGDPGFQGGNITVADNTFTDPNENSGGSSTVIDYGVGPLYDYGNVGPNAVCTQGTGCPGAAYNTPVPYVRAPQFGPSNGITAAEPDDLCTNNNNCPGMSGSATPQMAGAVQGNAITTCSVPSECSQAGGVPIIIGAGSSNSYCSNYTSKSYSTLVTATGATNSVCANGQLTDPAIVSLPTLPAAAQMPVDFTLIPSSYSVGGQLPCTPGYVGSVTCDT